MSAAARASGVALVAALFAVSGQGAQFDARVLDFRVTEITFPIAALDFANRLIRAETSTSVEVTLPADVLFDFDKADIRADAHEALKELAELLRAKARRSITVVGHTDALGNDGYNQRLSERRAEAVKAWLAQHAGIKSPPITTSGRGRRDPVAPNKKADGSDDPDGRQLNRRVVILFQK